jgi:hypothetical protein
MRLDEPGAYRLLTAILKRCAKDARNGDEDAAATLAFLGIDPRRVR